MATVPNAQELAKRKAVQAELLQAGSIQPRIFWNPRPVRGQLDYDWNYDSIVVHYTGHESYITMRAIQDLDMEHRSWQDIAYPYGITKEGQIIEGREILYKGSDVLSQNTGKIGIVCMGDFDSSVRNLLLGKTYAGEAVPVAMLLSLKRLSLLLRQNFPIQFFGGHIEYGRTETCPGRNLLPAVQQMRTELRLKAPVYRDLQ